MTPDQFKAWRVRLGFDQIEAAAALGISRGSVQNYERGARREDERPAPIPLTVIQACDAVALEEAVRRGDPSVLPEPLADRVRRLAEMLSNRAV